MESESDRLFSIGCGLQCCDVQFDHFHHGLHDAAGLCLVGVSQELGQHHGRYLPIQAEAILEPAAGDLLAATCEELVPVVIHLFLRVAVHRQGDGICQGMAGAAIHQSDLLSFQLDGCHEEGSFGSGGTRRVAGEPDYLRALENRKIVVHRFFGVVVEPNERADPLHNINFIVFQSDYKRPRFGYISGFICTDLWHMKNQNSNTNAIGKVWFITGSSRGFGRIWAEAALKRGDKVAATARNLKNITDLKEKYGANVLTLELDVTKPDQVKTVVTKAHEHFGRLDIILNNAGYSLVGTIEEGSAEEVRKLYDTNIFGPLAVIQCALPLLRKQGGGHILGVSSGLGHVTMPVIGYYCSSKWAFEAIHESLAAEVRQFGIKVTIIEPGAYATEFGSQESLRFAAGLDIYTDFKTQFFDRLRSAERGDPSATPEALFQIVDAPHPPLRFFLGSHNLPWVRAAYNERLKIWEEWESVSNAAQGQLPEKV